jgi:broad specificity phosphatase PhoE
MIDHAPAHGRRADVSVALQAAISEAMDRIFLRDAADATEVVLVRHAEPDLRAAIKTGNADPPLTERGRCQAMRLAMRLRRERIDVVYTSTARASLETAAAVAAAKDMPMIRAPQLAGVACTRTVSANAADHQKLVAEFTVRFMNNPRWDALRTFEPTRQFRHRAIQTVEAIISRHPGQRIVLVTHEAVTNAYLGMVLGIDRDMFFMPQHSSISTVRVLRDMYGVQNLNDTSHLMKTFTPK